MAGLYIITALCVGVTVCAIIGGCVWRRRRKKYPQVEERVIVDGRQPAQPTPPPPNPSPSVQGAPADDPVNAGDPDIEQQLPEADVHAGAIHDDIHHTRDNSREPLWRRSVASNEDVTSVCHMPIEETAPQEKTTSYPRPTQVEDNSGGAQLTVRGMRRLSMTSEAAPTLVREGDSTEVRIVLYSTIYTYTMYATAYSVLEFQSYCLTLLYVPCAGSCQRAT